MRVRVGEVWFDSKDQPVGIEYEKNDIFMTTFTDTNVVRISVFPPECDSSKAQRRWIQNWNSCYRSYDGELRELWKFKVKDEESDYFYFYGSEKKMKDIYESLLQDGVKIFIMEPALKDTTINKP